MIVAADSSSIDCQICGGAAPLCGVVDFHKSCIEKDGKYLSLLGIPVYYRRCENCGFMFCDSFKDWTHEEFSQHIYNDDYVIVDPDYTSRRSFNNAKMIERVFSDKNIYFIDYGGGNGVCAMSLRKMGYRADTYDPFSEHRRRPQEKADIVTAFEVIEHSTRPHRTLEDMLSFVKETGMIFFTTLLQPPDFDPRKAEGMNWWYIGPRNGHVSLHTHRSLSLLFSAKGLTVASISDDLHLAYRKLPAFAAHLRPSIKTPNQL